LKPDSAKKQKRVHVITRPDIDNCYKSIADSLNNYLYQDDSQIVEAHIYKRYTTDPKHIGAAIILDDEIDEIDDRRSVRTIEEVMEKYIPANCVDDPWDSLFN
jgi:hypothetical protein